MIVSNNILGVAHFRSLEHQERMRGLLLILVLSLHVMGIFYFLNTPKPFIQKLPKVIEVVMLPPVEPIKIEPIKEPSPAPVVKKEPIKPLVKLRPVVVKPPEPVKKPLLHKVIVEPQILTTTSENVVANASKFESSLTSSKVETSNQGVEKSNSKATETSGYGKDDSKNTGIECIKCEPPVYPARLKSRHIEGWVKIEFTITAEGEVTDAVVISAEPADVFDEAVLSKIEDWQLKPKITNGVAVKQRATRTLHFKLVD